MGIFAGTCFLLSLGGLIVCLNEYYMATYRLQNKEYPLQFPVVMGVLNVTPDSFSDGGQFVTVDLALERARRMLQEGAQIIDVGAESTRPGSLAVSAEEELARLQPVVEALLEENIFVSVDSNKLSVQRAMLQAGVPMINDVFGGSAELFALAEQFQAALVLMHTSALPEVMQEHTDYEDVVVEIRQFFDERWSQCQLHNIPRVWMDPGIGFGKTLSQNLALLKAGSQLQSEHWGLLLGASRKSWVDALFGAAVTERLGASLAAAVHGLASGFSIVRVHDVLETVQYLETQKILTEDG